MCHYRQDVVKLERYIYYEINYENNIFNLFDIKKLKYILWSSIFLINWNEPYRAALLGPEMCEVREFPLPWGLIPIPGNMKISALKIAFPFP